MNIAAIGAEDGTIHLWDRMGKTDVARLEGHKSPVAAVAISPDGKLLSSKAIEDGLRALEMQLR